MEENKTQLQKKLPKLTKKRRGFVNDYVKDENGQEAAKKNFNVSNDNSARAVASELLTFPNVIEAIEVKRKSLKQALTDKGIDEDYLAGKVEVLLNAVDKEGTSDYTAIDKGLKHASSWYGVENPEDKPKGNSTYNFFFNEDVQKEIREIEDRIKSQLTKNVQKD